MSTINLPSTFVSSGLPNTNFSTSLQIAVGTSIPSLGTCRGLLQIPTLPACPAGTTLTSAYLQLGVNAVTATGTIDVQKVTGPTPLNTSTVTNNTPGLTLDGIAHASKSITSSEVGTTVQFDVTSLISSYFTTSFPGIALVCSAGGPVYFDSSVVATPPLLIINCNAPVTIAGHQVTQATENVTATTTAATSTPQDVSQQNKVSFFITNNDAATAATAAIEASGDGTNYTQVTSAAVPANSTIVLVTNNCAKYARVNYSTAAGTANLDINYIAQA